MFRILTSNQFTTNPWKNGGGVTHEIARQEKDGAWVWRLSIAEVASDGPFSQFEGLSRILTVIEGNGINLQTPNGILSVAPLHPVHFSGDIVVDSKLNDGAIRDLNVIYDSRFIEASVEVVTGQSIINVGAVLTGFLCLSGSITIAGN